jgi:4-methyl-5(b-hydroxyethyl)-thiazole monophosphate biosynthesis
MAKVLVLLADGFEEIEAVTIIDVLRRAEVEVTVVGVGDGPARGSHGIPIVPERHMDQMRIDGYDALVLPGGMPGSANLRDDKRVLALLKRFNNDGKLLGAICAAPIALEAAGVLAGRRATSFPGLELPSAEYVEERVVTDGQLITSRGAGTAMEFALALVERLVGADQARELADRMLVRR